jgi:predicted NBD/HSP70 family sugar kinase
MRVAAAEAEGAVAEPRIINTPQAWGDAHAALAGLLKEASGGEQPEAVLGGIAGVIKDGVLMRSPNLPGWLNVSIAGALRELYPNARVAVENDAAVAALGEARIGAGAGYDIVAYLTAGTGIGGARIAGGMLERRAWGYEPGWQIIGYAGGDTAESVASGHAIARRYGSDVSAAGEDAQEEVARGLAVAAYNAVAHWSPHAVVLGGAVIHDVPGLFERVGKRYQALPPLCPEMPPVLKGVLGDKAGLMGAFML